MIEWILAVAFLIPATFAALYYFGLTLLSRSAKVIRVRKKPATRFAILVPAHNEALSLPSTLESVAKLDYPVELMNLFVVADNCSDDTAAIARLAGATVLERNEPTRRGKGYGLDFALKKILPTMPDAVLMLDADGELAPDALRIFDARFADGAKVVQGSIRTRNASDGPSGLVAAVGNVMDDAIASGRDSLGWKVPLRGSNMAFRRDVLEEHPWTCYGLTEDAEYSAKLQAAGIAIRFEPRAYARSESPSNLNVLTQQRRRWRAALGIRNWLDSKPLVLAHLLLTTMIVIIASLMNPSTAAIFAIWLSTVWIMTAAVYAHALRRIEKPLRLKTLLSIPRVVLKLATVTLGGMFARETHWQRTRRAAESV